MGLGLASRKALKQIGVSIHNLTNIGNGRYLLAGLPEEIRPSSFLDPGQ